MNKELLKQTDHLARLMDRSMYGSTVTLLRNPQQPWNQLIAVGVN